jgi:uncharacterized membrane protein YhdT
VRYYFRATAMALLCLVQSRVHCYVADSDADPPLRLWPDLHCLGVPMRFMHLCYAALGFAVARWVFRRQPVADPVSRLRSSGLL